MLITQKIEFKHFHLFCGAGGGAKGFNRASARVGNMAASFRCLGGIDVDAASIKDFGNAAGVPGTVMDLFDAEQYQDFHGKKPPFGWRERTPDDVRKAAGNETPDVIFMSPPCKSFSGLLSETLSKTTKYQALNRLTLRGIMLAMEAWSDDPVPLIILENVPRIATRGRVLLDQMTKMLEHYGYVVRETKHDCGELGGLAQTRKRFLLVARFRAKVGNNLYVPPKRRLRGVGEILGRMTMPGDAVAGPMHRVPSLEWQTWVRLAFVQAGSDWRSLNKLVVQADGTLRDYMIMPEMRGGVYGVAEWNEPSGTVAGRSLPTNGKFAVADPRAGIAETKHNNNFRIVRWDHASGTITAGTGPSSGGLAVADPRGVDRRNAAMGVLDWGETAGTVAGESLPSNGKFAVADPRFEWDEKKTHGSKLQVLDYGSPAPTVIGSDRVGSGAMSVADPRFAWDEKKTHGNRLKVLDYEKPAPTVIGSDCVWTGALSVADPRPGYGEAAHKHVLKVTSWDESSGTVTSGHSPSNGAMCVADPRPGLKREKGDAYHTAGHFGVVPWNATSGAISAWGQADNGKWSVADPRLPNANQRGTFVIRAEDDTWHRPFTTLELAALQSYIEPEEYLQMSGLNDQEWRERIGNMVPAAAAQAIGETMLRTLLLATTGEGFELSNVDIWVRDLAIALSITEPDIHTDN